MFLRERYKAWSDGIKENTRIAKERRDEKERLRQEAWDKANVTDLSTPGAVKWVDTYNVYAKCRNCGEPFNIRQDKGKVIPAAVQCVHCKAYSAWQKTVDYSGWI